MTWGFGHSSNLTDSDIRIATGSAFIYLSREDLCEAALALTRLPGIGISTPVNNGLDSHPWYWEGNVQATLVRYLAIQGYLIKSVADTASKSPGKDIVASTVSGRDLWISVKGYPENSAYVQARHWFAGAIFDLILYHDENPAVDLAIALPDSYKTYLNLANRVVWLRNSMPFHIYWIDIHGNLRVE
jgi:hypothetical protein